MTDEINDHDVIDISVERSRRGLRFIGGGCHHTKVMANEEQSDLICRDCGIRLNPVIWIVNAAEFFSRIKASADRYQDARKALEKRSRCKCRHCGRITEIREPTSKEMEVERNARIAEGSLIMVKNAKGEP
jgi:hypothetical protein